MTTPSDLRCPKFAPAAVHELYPSQHRTYLVLDGRWRFALDPDGTGPDRGLDRDGAAYDDRITVPGCLEAEGKGMTRAEDEQPGWWGGADRAYSGASWHLTEFDAPPLPAGQRALLQFGGVATECTVYLNGTPVGENEYAIIPFGFDVTDVLRPGAPNTLAVCVRNTHRYARAPLNHTGLGSTTVEIQWSGIFRSVELVYAHACRIGRMALNWDGARVHCLCRFEGPLPEGCTLSLEAFDPDGASAGKAFCGAAGSPVLPIDSPRLWFPQDPQLYRFTLTLLDRQGVPLDSLSERFGLRTLRMQDGKPTVNGVPVYLRGDMVHYHWPETVCTPTDRDRIRQKLSVYKQFGMNFLRHHTHFPTPEYLDVCDELGLMCHNELGLCGGLWGIEEAHAPALWSLAVERDQNHPSVIVWCMGNEKLFPAEQIRRYAQRTFQLDRTRFLITDSPGWVVEPDGGLTRWPVMHEFRMSGASYIDLALAEKYASGPLRPWRMEFTEKRLRRAGLLRYAARFTRSTQLLQRACRKILLEQVRENSVDVEELFNLHGVDYTGFVLSTFRDSGSFLWGTVDDFFGEKATSPAFFRQYVDDTVLLLGLKWNHRIFLTTQDRPWMPLVLSCSHYGRAPIEQGRLTVRVTDSAGETLFSSVKSGLSVGLGRLVMLDAQVYPYDNVPDRYQKLTVRAELTWPQGHTENHWDVWLAPAPALAPECQRRIAVRVDSPWLYTQLTGTYPDLNECGPDTCTLLVTDRLDGPTMAVLARGGRVLLVGQHHFPTQVTEWGSGRSEYARGTVLGDHPLWAEIPHEGWCDVPFAGLISDNRVLEGNRDSTGCAYVLDERWPQELEPIILGVPSYKEETPHRLAHLFEVGVGPGVLMAGTLKFGSPHAQSAFDLFFLDRILSYLTGETVAPRARMAPEALLACRAPGPSFLQMALRDVNVFRSERRG